MRLAFAGTPVFAERALAALHAAGHTIALVLTRPDKPAQRGQKLLASPVKTWALEHDIEVFQPRSLREEPAWEPIRHAQCELMIVAAYGLILPQAVLDIPRLGCLNIHASLLPRWRGAAPIQRAIMAGDRSTGVCIMQMEAGLDTGPVRLRHELAIGADESGGSLHDRLAQLGATSIVEAMSLLEGDALPMHPQPDEGVTYATKIGRADSMLDFTQSAQSLVDRIRALDPAPGCVAALSHSPQTLIKVWAARPVTPGPITQASGAAAHVGTVLAVDAEAITVACGSAATPQAIALLELQRPGGRRMPVRAFLSGFALRPGDRLCAPMAAADPASA